MTTMPMTTEMFMVTLVIGIVLGFFLGMAATWLHIILRYPRQIATKGD